MGAKRWGKNCLSLARGGTIGVIKERVSRRVFQVTETDVERQVSFRQQIANKFFRSFDQPH